MIETAEDQMEASCPEEKTRIKFGTSLSRLVPIQRKD